jgi:hypothetical protein
MSGPLWVLLAVIGTLVLLVLIDLDNRRLSR